MSSGYSEDKAKSEKLRRLNVEIPENLHKELKKRALEEDKTLKDFVILALEAAVKKADRIKSG